MRLPDKSGCRVFDKKEKREKWRKELFNQLVDFISFVCVCVYSQPNDCFCSSQVHYHGKDMQKFSEKKCSEEQKPIWYEEVWSGLIFRYYACVILISSSLSHFLFFLLVFSTPLAVVTNVSTHVWLFTPPIPLPNCLWSSISVCVVLSHQRK